MNKPFITILLFAFFVSSVANAELLIITVEEPPTNYEHNGQITGTSADIVERIIKNLNLKTKIRMLPPARAIHYLMNRPDVIFFTLAYTPERVRHGLHYIAPVITTRLAFYKKKDAPVRVGDIGDIKAQGLLCGVARGDWREKLFKDKGLKIHSVTNYHQSFKMLLADRIDLVITSDIEAETILKKLNLPHDSVEQVLIFEEAQSYIAASRDTSRETVGQWKNAFEALKKTDFFKVTTDKYKKILGDKLDYLPEKGFYIKESEK